MELCKTAKSLNEAAITKVSSKTPSCHYLLVNGHFSNFPTVYTMCLSPITVIIYNHGQKFWDTFAFLGRFPIHSGPTPPLSP